MSELLENKVNACLKKYFRAHVSSHKPMKKCAMEMKQRKNDACKNIIDERRAFIRYAQKTRPMDINQLQIDDC